jgi:3''-phosphoadenosine 5''-phosphosulfate sulfotransferase (PAPS reductase)/FAD synthetase and related enzymes
MYRERHTQGELDYSTPADIMTAMIKTERNLDDYEKVIVSISGGADSDIVLDMIERVGHEGQVEYVWFNTGMEYQATKNHLLFLEGKYGIKIKKLEAIVPVPLGCKRHGVPFISKEISQHIHPLQKHGFRWEDKPFEVLCNEYSGCTSALRWWCNEKEKGYGISGVKWLKEFLMANPPTFPVSPRCCDGAKKNVVKRYIKGLDESNILEITGIRRAEGGARASAYSSCFSEKTEKREAHFRPIFYFSDAVKAEYERYFGVQNSACYTDYGFKRTGCAGCPFNSKWEDELKVVEQHEPKLYKAAWGVFGEAYEYHRAFRDFKDCMNHKQTSLF